VAKNCDLRVWKKIELGIGRKLDHHYRYCYDDVFRRALEEKGYKVTDRAFDIMGVGAFFCNISESRRVIKLSTATTEELIGRAGTLAEIIRGINDKGGGILSPEAGPQLRMQYWHQPKGECLYLAMNPIDFYMDEELCYIPRTPYIFTVEHGRFLGVCEVDSNAISRYNVKRVLSADWRWVFRSPSPSGNDL
jgi:hypothetical protein